MNKKRRLTLGSLFSGSEDYKYGNGVALTCVWFVLSAIVWANEKEALETQE